MEHHRIETVEQLAVCFDQTFLKHYVARADFESLCRESARYGFKMVAVNPAAVGMCKSFLGTSSVRVGAAIGFPLGQSTVATKVFETHDAIDEGADEIDYVINIVELKSGNIEFVQDEMRRIVDVCREHGVTSKVIFENCFLTHDEKVALCELAARELPDFIKTSTGFGTGGATVEDVKLMRAVVGDSVRIKAAGSIRTLESALAMLSAGASRIGTSAGPAIVEEYRRTIAEDKR